MFVVLTRDLIVCCCLNFWSVQTFLCYEVLEVDLGYRVRMPAIQAISTYSTPLDFTKEKEKWASLETLHGHHGTAVFLHSRHSWKTMYLIYFLQHYIKTMCKIHHVF